MDAWANGLNYYLATHPEVRPRVLTRFEPWMALSFTEGSIGGDIERADLGQLAAFYGGQGSAQLLAAAGEPSRAAPTASPIAPALTRDGHALLLINPHTSFFFRSELGMESGEGLHAYGASTWGQFFIYQGFNERVGWMHTSSGVDSVDEFAETIVRRGRPPLLPLRQRAPPGPSSGEFGFASAGSDGTLRRSAASPPTAPITARSSAPRASAGSRWR